MDFQTHSTPDTVEVHLNGRMEFTDHDRLREIAALIDSMTAKRLVLDLSRLEFIDSAGLGMLLILQEEADGRGIAMAVRGVRGDVRRSIELARLGDILAIAD